MPSTLTFLLLMLFSLTAFAGDTKVAVLEFQGSLPPSTLQTFSDSVRGGALDILPPGEFSLMELENMLVIMSDMGLDASCLEGSCEVDLARNIGADYVISGKVIEEEGNLLCTVKVHETKSGKLLEQSQITRASAKDLREALPREVKVLIGGSIPGASLAGGGVTKGSSTILRTVDRGENIVNKQSDKSGFLVITSDPNGADIYVNGELVGQAPVQLSKSIGDYVINANLGRLYHEASERISLGENETARVELPLKAAFGTLVVNSKPSGATVYISGERKGVTPFQSERMPSDVYNIRLELSNHITYQDRIIVEDDKTTTVEQALEKSVGDIILESSPSGATVMINGEPRGQTPVRLSNQPPGDYQVRVSMPLYLTEEFVLNLEKGKSAERKVQLTANWGSLPIESNPPGASITLNGEKTNFKTPYTFDRLQAGLAMIELEKDGYGRWAEKVTVPGKGAAAPVLKAEMQAYLATITVTAMLPDGSPCIDGKVFIDDEQIGLTPIKKQVVAIPHRLTVDCNGMRGVKAFTPKHNDELDLQVQVLTFSRDDLEAAKAALAKSRTLDFVLYGIGGAGLVTSGVTFGSYRSSLASANGITDASQAAQFEADVSAARSSRNLSLVSMGIGIPAVTLGVMHQLKSTQKHAQKVEDVEAVISQ